MAGTYSVEKLNSASKSFARFSNCCFIMLRYLSAMLSIPVSDVIPIKTNRQLGHWKKHIDPDIHINSDIRSLTLSLEFYGPVNTVKVMSSWSVNLLHTFPGSSCSKLTMLLVNDSLKFT